MFKSVVVALLAAVGGSAFAQAGAFDRGMDTLWEGMWHQSGVPTRVVRWEKDLQVRFTGVNVAAHRGHTMQALRAAAAETGVRVHDVTDRADAAQQANVTVEITPDGALNDYQPCETRLDYQAETRIEGATLLMRDGEARRCAYHETMHVMGVRGHPEGDTVLSYFTEQTEGLQPLDKAMLRAWYSPRTRAGMTPFEFLPILADQLVAISPNQAKARQARDAYLARTFTQMQDFAEGRGDIPAIVKHSGKWTPAGVRFGRMEMSYFLGVAYLEGATVARDDAQGLLWLQRAADMGNRTARARLAGGATTVSGAGR